ncbi:hypothetical protein [Alkalicoccus halolimnae]|uniref:Uncharacterized protein n=1 Tax=Alkalicoccus halolimnae TaxID=1667239 RepID=A0A5C7FMW2_9BACI|nr:hypothetical protein [Alkalicoccus halolimnae]TXF86105.1 hypothetical protein FTX54_05675 [Alkalicoccus halolimnae]
MWTRRERDDYLSQTAAFLAAQFHLSDREAYRLIREAGLKQNLLEDPQETTLLSPKAQAEKVFRKSQH